MPKRAPQGAPQGAPQEVSQEVSQEGHPQGYPQGVSQGVPQEVPQGSPQGVSQGVPQEVPQGYPQGVSQGATGGGSELDAKKWCRARHERFIVDFLTRCGCTVAAGALAREAQLSSLIDTHPLLECRAIAAALESRDASPAIAWCQQRQPQLGRRKGGGRHSNDG